MQPISRSTTMQKQCRTLLASSLSGHEQKKDGDHEHLRTKVMKKLTGWKPIPREQKKDGDHEHLRTNVMKKLTGWKPIPREQTTCSTVVWLKRLCRAPSISMRAVMPVTARLPPRLTRYGRLR